MTDQTNIPRVAVVVLNWNGWRDTTECLESVLRMDYPNFQVLVCDNDSQDQSVEHIEAWANGREAVSVTPDHPLRQLVDPPVPKPVTHCVLSADDLACPPANARSAPLVLIRTGGNLGFAGGNNVGLRFALEDPQLDYVWLLNNDTVIEPDCLSRMVSHSEQLRASGVRNTSGSVQCFYDDPSVIQALGGFRINKWTGICSTTLGRFLRRDASIDHASYRAQLHTIHGCSWLLPRDYLDSVGLMDDRYFLYYEEIDWTLRAKGQYQLTYAEDAFVYHKEGSSIGSKTLNRGSSLLSEFYTARNRYWLALKFFPWYLPTIFLGSLLQAANRLRRGEFQKAWLMLKTAFGKQTFP